MLADTCYPFTAFQPLPYRTADPQAYRKKKKRKKAL